MIPSVLSMSPAFAAMAATITAIEPQLHMTLGRNSIPVPADGQFWPRTKPVNACLMNSPVMMEGFFEVIDWNDSTVSVRVLQGRAIGGSSHGMGIKEGETLTLPRAWITTEYFSAG